MAQAGRNYRPAEYEHSDWQVAGWLNAKPGGFGATRRIARSADRPTHGPCSDEQSGLRSDPQRPNRGVADSDYNKGGPPAALELTHG